MRTTSLLPFILLVLLPGASAATWDIVIQEAGPQDNGVQFAPRDLTIAPGDTVTWTDDRPGGHTTTSDGNWDHAFSGTRGDSFSFTFEEAGVYEYYCRPHSWMSGTITVESGGPTASPSPTQTTSTSTGPSSTTSSTTTATASSTTTAPSTGSTASNGGPDGDEKSPLGWWPAAVFTLVAAVLRRRL